MPTQKDSTAQAALCVCRRLTQPLKPTETLPADYHLWLTTMQDSVAEWLANQHQLFASLGRDVAAERAPDLEMSPWDELSQSWRNRSPPIALSAKEEIVSPRGHLAALGGVSAGPAMLATNCGGESPPTLPLKRCGRRLRD